MAFNLFRDLAKDLFGMGADDVPETIPLRLLGLPGPSIPSREAITSAFRRRVLEVHPDVQLAYDHPVLQAAAGAALEAPF